MSVIAAYATDQRDSWPYPLGPGFIDPFTGQQIRLTSPYGVYTYTWSGYYWMAPLASYYGIDPFDPALDCPNSPFLEIAKGFPGARTRPWATARELSMSLLLEPAALASPGDWDSQHFRAQRQSDVLFASQKAALFDYVPFHDQAVVWIDRTVMTVPPWSLTVAACDGSARLRHQAACIRGVVFAQFSPRFEGAELVQAVMDTFRFTPDGVRGRDW